MSTYYSVEVKVYRDESLAYHARKPQYLLQVHCNTKKWWFESIFNEGKPIRESVSDVDQKDEPLMKIKYFDTSEEATTWALQNIPTPTMYNKYINSERIKHQVAIEKYNYSRTIIKKVTA